jgi:hypothetical protein
MMWRWSDDLLINYLWRSFLIKLKTIYLHILPF